MFILTHIRDLSVQSSGACVVQIKREIDPTLQSSRSSSLKEGLEGEGEEDGSLHLRTSSSNGAFCHLCFHLCEAAVISILH